MRAVRCTVALTAVLILSAVACSNEGSSTVSGGGLYGGGSPSTAPSASSSGSGAGGGYGHGSYGNGGGGNGGGGGAQSGGRSALTVTQTDYVFTPSTPKVASGDTVTISNGTPSTPHTFTVTGEDIDVEVDPQSSTDVKVDLPPGTYPFICRFHEASGMTGTLTVT
jgi:plastocyanin